MKSKSESKERAVVICTAKRGVFYGMTAETSDAIIERGKVILRAARMCTYWSAETKGVLGLASIGPQRGSKIGLAIEELAIESVTAVMVCSSAAALAWETGQWA